jgi:hypothetical protein
MESSAHIDRNSQDWRAAAQSTEITILSQAEKAAAGAKDAIDEVFSAEALARFLHVMKEQRR